MEIIKRTISIMLCIVLSLAVCGCGERQTESVIDQNTTIFEVVNAVDKKIRGIGLGCVIGETVVLSTAATAANNQPLAKDQHFKFELERNDLPAGTDFNSFGLSFTIIEADGSDNNICTLCFPLEFGKQYYFEVRNDGDDYQIWANVETTAIDLKEADEEIEQQFDVSMLIGPWHLDETENDLSYYAELFDGYAEWGASLELTGDGHISWYIGAYGGSGQYTTDGTVIKSEIIDDSDGSNQKISYRINYEQGKLTLYMPYRGLSIIWAYGDNGEIPASGNDFLSGLAES